MKLGGWLGAAVIIFGTTVDDTVWLVPYITSRSLSPIERVLHALLFITTLQALTFVCVLLASGIRYSLPIFGYDDESKQEHVLICISAVICWVIAGLFYLKAVMKRRKRQRNKDITPSILPTEEERPLSSNINTNYGMQSQTAVTDIDDCNIQGGDMNNYDTRVSFSPITVISLTSLGALDELSYFPSLITGHLFCPRQLFIGAFLASAVILVVVSAFLSKCKPLLDWLDSIPLYVVIGIFAALLTIQLFL